MQTKIVTTLQKSKGFTLIELLVVIAIISLLVSMLLPALNTAKELGRTAYCASTQKNVGSQIMLFADEHKEMYPWGFKQGYTHPVYGTTNTYWYWPYSEFSEYLGIGWRLPGSQAWTQEWLKYYNCPSLPNSYYDYLANRYFFAFKKPGYAGHNPRRTLSTVPQPATTAMLWDQPQVYVSLAYYSVFNTSKAQAFSQVHSGGSNVLFADTHVVRIDYDDADAAMLYADPPYASSWPDDNE